MKKNRIVPRPFSSNAIHSKDSRLEFYLTNRETTLLNFGKVYKGATISKNIPKETSPYFFGFSTNIGLNDFEKEKNITYNFQKKRPFSHVPHNRKMKRLESIENEEEGNEVIQSESFSMIYFKKIKFPPNGKALFSNDPKISIIFVICTTLFKEINLNIYHLLVCYDMQSNSFYSYFTDSHKIPFSKCCDWPIYLQIKESLDGFILCNNPNCSIKILKEFKIAFNSSNKPLIIENEKNKNNNENIKHRKLNKNLNFLISSGKYKKTCLMNEIYKTNQTAENYFSQKLENKSNRKNYFPTRNEFDDQFNQIEKHENSDNNEKNNKILFDNAYQNYEKNEKPEDILQNPLNYSEILKPKYRINNNSENYVSRVRKFFQDENKYQKHFFNENEETLINIKNELNF